jgi:hypothetical protein
MLRLSALLPSLSFACALALTGCPGDPPVNEGEGEEGEGEGEEGEGEGEGEGDPQPPTEPIREPDAGDPDNATLDSDCDGLTDLEEFANTFAGGERTDPADYDSDDDGIADGVELGRTADIDVECPATWKDADSSTTTSPIATDSDGDCRSDGVEDANKNGRVDANEGDPNSDDSDGDGILDAEEDANCNGTADAGETNAQSADTDGDGINDGVEVADGLDPRNPDSDGDGIPDGVDVNPGTPDPDADGDGVPASVDPNDNDADRDDDGLEDGEEDTNRNGRVDANETDPARADTDGDGLNDAAEAAAGTNPRLADSDADLLNDAVEVANGTNPNNRDSDSDGIADGLEDRNGDGNLGGANPNSQETDPLVADTDGDGIDDGDEDRNRNGRVDAGETDPRVRDADDDNDGLSNQQEAQLGTNPAVPDTDGDGIRDGDEVNVTGTIPTDADSDDDGINDGIERNTNTDPLSPDTDGDGILDGVEDRDRDGVRDNGETDPRNDDSDGDGVVDGAEDGNQNGVVDAGELNPLDPTDVNGTISAACATPITPGQFPESTSDILLALAPDFAAANVRPIVRGGVNIGTSAFDPTRRIFAFALNRAPAATATAQLTAIEAGLGADLSLPITQAFTTWDGFEAQRGTYNIASAVPSSTKLQQVARLALGLGVNDASLSLDFAGAPSENGNIKLGLVVVRRSNNTSIVVGVATNLAQFDDPASGRDFRLEDIGGGTAQAQVGDAIGTQCDVFPSTADTPADFFFVIDNSGSMGDEIEALSAAVTSFNAAVANSELDARVAAVTTEFQYKISGPVFANNDDVTGECVFPAQVGTSTRICACAFTSPAESAQFSTCVDQIRDIDGAGPIGQLGGSGAEGGYGALRAGLAEVFTLAGSPARRKVRANAKVVAIFVTDAGEQSANDINVTGRTPYVPAAAFSNATTLFPNEAGALATSVTFWADFFGNRASGGWDLTRNNEPPMFLGGVLCPLALQQTVRNGTTTIGCNGEEDATGPNAPSFNAQGVGGRRFAIARYYDVITDLGGISGSIADSFGNGFTGAAVANIGITVEAILEAVVTASSPYQLTRDPISSTIKVALETPTVGACNAADVPRVTDLNANGFLYDATTNSIAFVGTCRPQNVGTDVAVSYRTWIDLTGDPDGDDQPCGGDCPDPLICVNDQCVCPSDCGLPGGLADGQTCDTLTDGNSDGFPDCIAECLPDCGGCTPGQVCDVDSANCACGCPADCNFGGALPPGFVCNPATCQAECAPDGCVGPPPGPGFVCGADCTYECADDCGGLPSENHRCDTTTCQAECAPDCNANCDGFTECNTTTCACECRESATCAPGFVFDAAACGCVCDAAALACPATHTADLDSCSCDCADNCGGTCGAGTVCDVGTCTCRGLGG